MLCFALERQLLYLTKLIACCQELFYFSLLISFRFPLRVSLTILTSFVWFCQDLSLIHISFSATGQLWGNPLYNWQYHKETDYAWWTRRIAHSLKLYDIVRIDHFRGFDEYYAIPYGDKTAEHGQWMPGPGLDFFRTIEKKLGQLPIICLLYTSRCV